MAPTHNKPQQDTAFKQVMQDYWTKNVPGLDLVASKFSPEEKDFYITADEYRYKYDAYIPGLIDSFASKDKLILEIGCGMGTDSRYMSKKGARVVSMDLSFNNVSFSLKGMDVLGFSGKGVNADAEKLPFKDNVFDAVYSFGVLHHTPDTQRSLNEVHRVLKPNGQAVIMLYHKGYAYYALLLMHGYKKLFGRYSDDALMSRYDSTPLSRLYSKKQIREMFLNFRDLDISITAFGGTQAHPVLKYVHRLLTESKFLMDRFGSFIIIKASK